jgi:uncharacterized repeat protein (TIGR01451 family)
MKVFSYIPKKLYALFAVAIAILGVAVVAQANFGPDRPTFTQQKPADYVTFNSITNNPVAGDERKFMTAAKPGGAWSDPVTDIKDGEEVTLRMFVHNNAAENLNLKAQNTMVRVAIPGGSAQTQQITGYVTADNAKPKSVFDTVDLTGAANGFMELQYVPGSASYKNNKGTFKLADSIVTTGAKVGYDKMDGVLPGCDKFSGWVTLKVKVNMPRYVIQKSARIAGEGKDDWRQSVNAKIGDTIEWRIEVRNNGSTTLKDIIVLDELPPYMTAEAGSVKLINGNHPATNPYVYDSRAIQEKDGKIFVNVNIGDYLPNSNAFVRFSSKIVNNEAIACDNQRLTNKSYATPAGYGSVSSYAYVVVVNDKACEEPKKPIYACDSLTVDLLGDRKIKATVKTTAANGAEYKTTKFNFGDGTELETDKTMVEHTYAQDGTYIVRAVPTFMVDGKLVTAESDACVKQVTFKGGEPVEPTPPTELPNTGIGSMLGLFAGVTAAGAAGHRLFTLRRNQ